MPLPSDTADHAHSDRLSPRQSSSREEAVRFSVDAALIGRLGLELVARQETALTELVKNSYDADATEVILRFQDARSPGGTLEITDNGSGMSREQLMNGFMRLSSIGKLQQPVSPRFKRQRAGRKGIGRFAAQRLGSELEIQTQTVDSDTALRLTLDWDLFQPGKDLGSVEAHVESLPKSHPEGTTLRIRNLRDGWSDAELRRAYRYLRELLQPFPLDASGGKSDGGFRVGLQRVDGCATTQIADEESEIYSYALAQIDGWIDREGHGHCRVQSERLEIDEEMLIGSRNQDPRAPFAALHGVRFRAYYFIFRQRLIPKPYERAIEELAQRWGGIRLYRNGFRVLPFGEKEDDWLELDWSDALRRILAPHRNQNFFGFVEVMDQEGRRFEETSSREGLIENNAFAELRLFVSSALKSAVVRIAEARGRKQTKHQPDWPGALGAVTGLLRDAEARLREAASDTCSHQGAGDPEPHPRTISDTLNQVASQIHAATNQQERETRALLEELELLRVLASLGIAVGEFTHEIDFVLGAIRKGAERIARHRDGDTPGRRTVQDLAHNVERLLGYASYFRGALADSAQRNLTPQSLNGAVEEFVDLVRPAARRRGITLCVGAADGPVVSLPMHSAELAAILFNFLSNSQKAIARAGVPGRIQVSVGHIGDSVYIDFADNGDGIPPQHRERVFNAFFTTTAPPEASAVPPDDPRGTGLGLRIVQDIVTGRGGGVYVVEAPADFSTCFRVLLRAANKEEMEEWFATFT